jgi:hypothetical protein
MIYKKSTVKCDILINGVPMEDAYKHQIVSYSDKLEFTFKGKNQSFVFNLEDSFLDFFLNPDYVFEKKFVQFGLVLRIKMRVVDDRHKSIETMYQLKQELTTHKITFDKLNSESRVYKFIQRSLTSEFSENEIREYMKAIQNSYVLFFRHIETREISVLNDITIMKTRVPVSWYRLIF